MTRVIHPDTAADVRDKLEALAREHHITVTEVLDRTARGELPPLLRDKSAWGIRQAMDRAAKPAAAPKGCTLALFTVEILDERAVRELDPTLKPGARVRLDAPWTERTVIARAGQPVVAFLPTDSGQPAADVSWPMLSLVFEACGQAGPQPEPSDAYLAEAEAWATGALADLPTLPIEQWLGQPRARRVQVQGRLERSFRVPRAVIERLAGPLEAEPLPSLWPAGADGTRIDEQRQQAKERATHAAQQAAAAESERRRPRTLAEVGAGTCIEVRLGGIHPPPPELAALPFAWGSPDGRLRFVLLEPLEGLPFPAVDVEAFKVLDPEAVRVPFDARSPLRVNELAYALLVRLLELRGVRDTGQIARFRYDLEADDERLVSDMARIVLYGVTPAESFRRAHVAALLVRGRLLDPALASEAVWARVLALHAGAQADRSFDMPLDGKGVGRPGARQLAPRPGRDHNFALARWVVRTELPADPLRPAMPLEELQERLIAAARGGLVRPGALLKEPADSAKHPKRTTKKG